MKTVTLLILSAAVARAQPARLGRLGAAAGGSLHVVSGESYDPYDANDRMGLGRLEASFQVMRVGPGEVVVQAAYLHGEQSDTLFGEMETNLVLQAANAGVRYRWPLDLGPVSLAPLLRADLGAYWASLRLRSSGQELRDRDAARGLEALGGVEVLIHPTKLRGLTGRFAYGGVLEAGYAWIGEFHHRLRSDVPEDTERLRRFGADPGPLDLSGPIVRFAAILRY